ncbi:component of IIS longevity pathway SMK-1-domain-containing protein [Scheffersomyces amazonensis]|uniref:component of IIS longevity pathway SMK-1-domain-containing protein n=1 Tax=Scheffersomyces amazonensis TaxID=1078765 RepID=UPI00315D5E20
MESSQSQILDINQDKVQLAGVTPRRVKVYLLQGEDWSDNGTGYCVGEIDESTKIPYFLVRNEQDSQDIILQSFLEGSIQYQRQQETLIVWTDVSGKDLALSFQEVEGCADLCEFIIKVQQEQYSPDISLYYVIPSLTEGEDITELITGPVTFPPDPNSNNIDSILDLLTQCANYQFKRFRMSKFIIDTDFFIKLVGVFEQAENSKSLNCLFSLFEIIKALILYNESSLIENFLSTEERIFALSGILEYDPEYPSFKACHRDFLKNKSFKTVIPVEKLKIFKKDFHLNYLKDVVLARLLDDQTFNLISSLIYMNQVEIINYLKDASILQKLFKIYDENDEISKRDGVKMLHQYVLIAKGLQTFQRSEFFSILVKSGLFKMINFALKDSDSKIRVLGTELIVIIIEQDVSLVNSVDNEENIDNSDPPVTNHIIEEEESHLIENSTEGKRLKLKLSDDMTLISILSKLLVEDKNSGLKVQAFEALKILLDSNIATGSESENSDPSRSPFNPLITNKISSIEIPISNNNINNIEFTSEEFEDINVKNYFRAFYSQVAPKLFQNLIKLAELPEDSINSDSEVILKVRNDQLLYQHLCELISFCTKEHESHISRPFFLENNILLGLGRLITINCKTILKLNAIRCLKSLIILNDNFYTRYIINNNLLHYFFDYFDSIANENNLANSTCLDFIELILKNCDASVTTKRQNYKLLASYIYKDFKEFCGTKINHVSTGRELIDLVENEFYDDCNSSSLMNGTETSTKNDDISFGSDEELLDHHDASTPINEEEEQEEEDNINININNNNINNNNNNNNNININININNNNSSILESDDDGNEDSSPISSTKSNSKSNSKSHSNSNSNSNAIKKKISSASKKIALSIRSKNNASNGI